MGKAPCLVGPGGEGRLASMDGFFFTWNGFDAHGLAYQVAREVFKVGEMFIQARRLAGSSLYLHSRRSFLLPMLLFTSQ